MKIGVYTITNLINNKIYVGSTREAFYIRKSRHFSALKYNRHTNKHLQNAYNKYGKENFIFEILEECDIEFCRSNEIYWTNMLNTLDSNYGYNICYPTENGFGYKHSEETKKYLSSIKLGKKHSLESRIQMSISRTGKKHTEATKLKMKAAEYPGKLKKGYIKSKISIEKHRIKLYKAVIQFDLEDNILGEYYSMLDAATKTNTDKSGISQCCLGYLKTSGGFKWKYKDLIN